MKKKKKEYIHHNKDGQKKSKTSHNILSKLRLYFDNLMDQYEILSNSSCSFLKSWIASQLPN